MVTSFVGQGPNCIDVGFLGLHPPLRNHHLFWIDAENQDKAFSGFEHCSHKLQVPVQMSQLRDLRRN